MHHIFLYGYNRTTLNSLSESKGFCAWFCDALQESTNDFWCVLLPLVKQYFINKIYCEAMPHKRVMASMLAVSLDTFPVWMVYCVKTKHVYGCFLIFLPLLEDNCSMKRDQLHLNALFFPLSFIDLANAMNTNPCSNSLLWIRSWNT